MSDFAASAPAIGGADPDLKRRMRRAERRRNLAYFALVLPLALLVLVAFVWPIASLLVRAVENEGIHDNLPQTIAALRGWNGQELPDERVYRLLADELAQAKGTPKLAAIATRLNREEAGLRSLVMKTARHLPLPMDVSAKEALIAIDPAWGETAIWKTLQRAGHPFTAFYLLAALDLTVDDQGHIALAPPQERVYLDVLGRTFWMSFNVTLLCLLLGFPVAYLMAILPVNRSNLLMLFVLLPFWTSVLVRIAAWIVLLQNEGLVNRLLLSLGLIESPLPMLFNRSSVYIGMIHILLPFMVLPLYSVMKGISPLYVRAALSLGCPPWRSFWTIYFPQTLPGVGAGVLLVFIMCMGYYITPALLGGPKEQMLSYFIAFYTNQTINWNMAAALSAILLTATLLLYAFYALRFGPTRVKFMKAR